ncbi:hypothetical protein MesoLjLa_29390 [Mesorhizobium sp. L-2-11]|nr:hypothetical protein MesoLjLa_29390 [Mesorhizobium sp. L-2-11]
MQCFAQRIDRAGADIAIDHAESAQHQDLGAVLFDLRMAGLFDWFCLTTTVGKGHGRHSDKRAVLYACCDAISSAPT